MTILAVERLSDLMLLPHDWMRSTELLQAHFDEVASFKHLLKLDPDFSRYQELERAGRLHVVVMRQEGEIVGYCVHVISNGLLHYRKLKVADDDVTFVAPHLRGTGEHRRMREFAMKTLKEKGIELVSARVRTGHERHVPTLCEIGFAPWDLVYACDLTAWEPPKEE
jgi:predicted GNAT family acetyltransferase